MFGLRKDENTATGTSIETVIGKDSYFKGLVSGTGNIRIDGRVEGEISLETDVIVGSTGVVVANIVARNVTIAGAVTGNITITGKLTILSSGNLYGDVRAAVLSISEGSIFRGNSIMDVQQQTDVVCSGT